MKKGSQARRKLLRKFALTKEKRRKKLFALRGARGGRWTRACPIPYSRREFAASPPRKLLKSLTKTFSKLTRVVCFVYSLNKEFVLSFFEKLQFAKNWIFSSIWLDRGGIICYNDWNMCYFASFFDKSSQNHRCDKCMRRWHSSSKNEKGIPPTWKKYSRWSWQFSCVVPLL